MQCSESAQHANTGWGRALAMHDDVAFHAADDVAFLKTAIDWLAAKGLPVFDWLKPD